MRTAPDGYPATWRGRSQRVIHQLEREFPDMEPDAFRELLQAHYPFHERDMYPYRVWCEEVRKAVGRRILAPAIAVLNTRPEEPLGGLFATVGE